VNRGAKVGPSAFATGITFDFCYKPGQDFTTAVCNDIGGTPIDLSWCPARLLAFLLL
jgi:hypothetical protein